MVKLTRKKSAAGNLDSEAARIKLECGHWFPRIREGEPPLSDDELRTLWFAVHDQLKAGTYAKNFPNRRLWGEWVFELLPADPRRRTKFGRARRAAIFSICRLRWRIAGIV
jgi:hypothetical protein